MITQFLVLSRFGLVLWRLKSQFDHNEGSEINASIDKFVTDVLLEERDVEEEKRRYVAGEVRYSQM